MTVLQLARRVGISPASVRMYGRSGVLPAPHPLADGTRGYDEDDASFLGAVVGLRRLGVPVDRVVAADGAGRLSGGERIRRIRGAVEMERRAIARQKGRLDELDARLQGVAQLLARTDATRVDPDVSSS